MQIMATVMLCSWRIDRRYHVNHFVQARAVVFFALFVNSAGFGLTLKGGPWLANLLVGLAAGAYWLIGLSWVRNLESCAKQYERNPMAVTVQQAAYYFQSIPPVRLMWVGMGFNLFLMGLLALCLPPHRLKDLGFLLFNSWMMFMGVAHYLAGVPPSPWERKKKEERAPLFALPSWA